MEKKTGNVMCGGVREVRSFSMNAEIERREKEQEKKQMKIERELNILDTINSIIFLYDTTYSVMINKILYIVCYKMLQIRNLESLLLD